MKKIIQAIQKNELPLFFLGKGEYHVHDGRNDLPQPNDFPWCWRSEIIPYLKEGEVKINFDDIFIDILKQEKDAALAIDSVMENLLNYYYFTREKIINIEIVFPKTEELLGIMLIENRELLIRDKRWAGVEWNSSNGLWGPLQGVAKWIKEECNGINLVIE